MIEVEEEDVDLLGILLEDRSNKLFDVLIVAMGEGKDDEGDM
jgi:hypothetical protein